MIGGARNEHHAAARPQQLPRPIDDLMGFTLECTLCSAGADVPCSALIFSAVER
jgi:hypothetical protein